MSSDLRARMERAVGMHLRPGPETPPHPDEIAIVDDVMAVVDDAIARVLHEYADRLDAIDPQCTALTGPAWYGQGWHEAAHHLHDLADDHPGRMRREADR